MHTRMHTRTHTHLAPTVTAPAVSMTSGLTLIGEQMIHCHNNMLNERTVFLPPKNVFNLKQTHSLTELLCVFCFPVFQERPEIPPSQAQAQARNIPPDEYSYTASIMRLLRNKPFMLLVLSYGGSLIDAFHKESGTGDLYCLACFSFYRNATCNEIIRLAVEEVS